MSARAYGAVITAARIVDQRLLVMRQRTVLDGRGERVFEGNDSHAARIAVPPGFAADLRALADAVDELVAEVKP